MFFVLSKIFWTLAQPLNALCLLGAVGLLVRPYRKRAGQAMMTAALALILFFGGLPIGPLLVTWLERQYPPPASIPEPVHGVIVLGGAFESHLSSATGQIVANDQVDRMLCFVDLARKYPGAKLVFSGGAGDILNPDALESDDARKFLQLAKLDRPVIYEEKSRNTYENVLYSKEIVKPEAGENWVMTTSAYHMPRSVGIFEKAGWHVVPYQCDPKTDGTYNLFHRMPNIVGNFHLLNLAFKELLGSFVYYVTGKTAFILPPSRVPSRNENPSG